MYLVAGRDSSSAAKRDTKSRSDTIMIKMCTLTVSENEYGAPSK